MPSLAEIGVRNRLAAGDKLWKATYDAAQAVTTVWCWAYTTRKLGRPPTRPEHAREWRCAERTVYRDLARFERVFPGADIDALAVWLNETAAQWVEDRTRSLQLPAPDDFAVAVT